MREHDLPEIQELSLFKNVSSENYQRLMRGAYVQNFPPFVDLIVEGDPCDFLHIVVSGSVELFAGWNDRETTMGIMRPISSFILAAVVQDAPQLMSARTLEKTRLVLVPAQDVRDIFAKDSEFARAIVSELARCYRDVVRSTKDLKLRTSIERLANYLLKLHVQAKGQTDFVLDVEKRRLASYLGMTPENLSRAIKSLRGSKVSMDGQNVTIGDIAMLEKLAKPTPLIDDPEL